MSETPAEDDPPADGDIDPAKSVIVGDTVVTIVSEQGRRVNVPTDTPTSPDLSNN